MHFDAITLAAVAHNLTQSIQHGRIQQLVQVDAHSFGFEIYANRVRHHLLISANPTKPRVHFVSHKLRRGVEIETPLLLLLRKYARGARVDQIAQPDMTERVLHIRIDHPEHGENELIIELIGRASNIIFLGPSDKIRDCLRRVRRQNENARDLLPNRTYSPPPKQDRLSPLPSQPNASAQRPLAAHLPDALSSDEPLWKALVGNLNGTSPTLAREIAWRVSGSPNTPANQADPATVAQTINQIWTQAQRNEWQPSLLYKNGQIAGYAPYQLNFGENAVATDLPAPATIHTALETYHAQPAGAGDAQSTASASGATDPYAAQRSNTAALIRNARKQTERRLKAVLADEPTPGEADDLRTKAEWILALSHQIEPGQTTIEIPIMDPAATSENTASENTANENTTSENTPQQIKLDPSKPPVEYAQGLFKRAAKLERAAEILPRRKAKLTSDLEFLAQLETDLQLAENQPEIAAVHTELKDANLLGHQQGKHKQRKSTPKSGGNTSRPRRYISPDGMAILVGRNARQNDKVTFDHAKPDDLWLHVRDVPGSHVVIRSGGQTVSEETLQIAAQLAAYYSSRRGERAAAVAVTSRRNVTRVPKGRAGQVYIRNEDTITVPAELPEDAMLSEER